MRGFAASHRRSLVALPFLLQSSCIFSNPGFFRQSYMRTFQRYAADANQREKRRRERQKKRRRNVPEVEKSSSEGINVWQALKKGPPQKRSTKLREWERRQMRSAKVLCGAWSFAAHQRGPKTSNVQKKKTKVTASKNLKTESLSRKLSRCSYVSWMPFLRSRNWTERLENKIALQVTLKIPKPHISKIQTIVFVESSFL